MVYRRRKRFIRYIDNSIIDFRSGLIWKQSDDSIQRSWQDALEYAILLKGKWRLPTVYELFTLVDLERDSPVINSIFSCHADYYWTSSFSSHYFDSAWYVHFLYGETFCGHKIDLHYVRCVRKPNRKENSCIRKSL